MDSPLILNLLWLIPTSIWLATRNLPLPNRSIFRGISFGLVVSPASIGLYALYYVGPIAAIPGMLGLVLSMFHGAAGYNIAVAFNLVPSNRVLIGAAQIPVELINSFIWASVYGLIGYIYGHFKIIKYSKNI
ncbi:MAG: hypothetical protein OEY52_02825 [Gammaproteobacteria bacterium]|nr:hypothetical protein [Gammaproteobacteria bacterium]